MEAIVALIVIGLIVIGTIATILLIGKPRKPITPGQAVIALIINSVIILGVLFLWMV
jgi:hypothetical protein